MANDFFTVPSSLVAKTLARAEAVMTFFTVLVSSFDKMPSKRALNEDRSGFCTDSGSANVYVLTLQNIQITNRPTDYQAGQRFSFVPQNTNTGPSTANIYDPNGALIGALNITAAGVALAAGAIVAGIVCTIECDGTAFQLISGGIVVATGGTLIIADGILIDGSDTARGKLAQKLLVSGSLSAVINNPGGNESMTISFTFDEGQVALQAGVLGI